MFTAVLTWSLEGFVHMNAMSHKMTLSLFVWGDTTAWDVYIHVEGHGGPTLGFLRTYGLLWKSMFDSFCCSDAVKFVNPFLTVWAAIVFLHILFLQS